MRKPEQTQTVVTYLPVEQEIFITFFKEYQKFQLAIRDLDNDSNAEMVVAEKFFQFLQQPTIFATTYIDLYAAMLDGFVWNGKTVSINVGEQSFTHVILERQEEISIVQVQQLSMQVVKKVRKALQEAHTQAFGEK